MQRRWNDNSNDEIIVNWGLSLSHGLERIFFQNFSDCRGGGGGKDCSGMYIQ